MDYLILFHAMLSYLFSSTRKNETRLILLAIAFGFSLSIVRVVHTQDFRFLFLIWNLFLAFFPYLLTSMLSAFPEFQKSRTIMLIVSLSWLLFFPNAPYILTDLFHLRLDSDVPIWYDLILILTYAWTGLLMGLLSLRDLSEIWQSKYSHKWLKFIPALLLFLASFGVYLGRYLRWNSWDILHQPRALLVDVMDRFIHPLDHPRSWGLTLLLGVFLNIVFLSFKNFKVPKEI